MSVELEDFADDDHSYDLWKERYLDALFADHDKDHPGRELPVKTCEYCINDGTESLPVDKQ